MKWWLLCFLLWVGPAHAVQPDEILPNASLETRARSLSEGLRCLVCQNQSIDESEAPLARDLRILIRERLTQGDSDQQVINFVVARYGDYVLLKPRLSPQTIFLWATPFVLVLAGLGILLLIRKFPSQEELPLTADEKEKLRKISWDGQA